MLEINIKNKLELEVAKCGCESCKDFLITSRGEDKHIVTIGGISKKHLKKLRDDIDKIL